VDVWGATHHPTTVVIARLVRAIQRRDVHRAKGLSRPADAGLLDYPDEPGNDGVEEAESQS